MLSGGHEALVFNLGSSVNVVQSAAPDGINGAINNTAPELNITSALVSIDAADLNLDRVAQNPCSLAARQNTLKSVGYGAVSSFKKGQDQQTLQPLLDLSTEDKTEESALPIQVDKSKALDYKNQQYSVTQVAPFLVAPTKQIKVPSIELLFINSARFDCQKSQLPPLTHLLETDITTVLLSAT